jgi:uncharacterized protein with FMN-binding domain
MSRKSRVVWANGFIAAGAVAGGLVLTNHYSTSEGVLATNNATQANTASLKSGTATSDPIPYEFGEVQITVIEKNGKITAIDTGTSSATGGREQAFPYLVSDAIAANGTNFGNLSGATYTTDAFKQALTSAVSKLG